MIRSDDHLSSTKKRIFRIVDVDVWVGYREKLKDSDWRDKYQDKPESLQENQTEKV